MAREIYASVFLLCVITEKILVLKWLTHFLKKLMGDSEGMKDFCVICVYSFPQLTGQGFSRMSAAWHITR